MAIDYGTKKIGLAFSDPMRSFVARTETIKIGSTREALDKIAEIISAEEVSGVILGLPLNEDGSEGEMAGMVRKFKTDLESRTGLKIILSDERFTSEEAQQYLHKRGKKIKGNKELIDSISAALILNDHLLDKRS